MIKQKNLESNEDLNQRFRTWSCSDINKNHILLFAFSSLNFISEGLSDGVGSDYFNDRRSTQRAFPSGSDQLITTI